MAQRFVQLNLNVQKEENYFEELGKSYDSAFLSQKRQVLISKAKLVTSYQASNKDLFTYDYASDQNEFSRKIKASASGQGSFGMGKVKASGSYKKFFSSNNFSLYIFGYVRFIRDRYVFDVNESVLEPHFEKHLRKNYPKKMDLIEKEIGDEVITGVNTASELFVKIEIQTSSQTNKEEIKASVSVKGTFGGSGGASFSSITSNIKNHKKISIDIYGNLPNGDIMENISAEALDKILLEYPTRSKDRFSVTEITTTPMRNLPQFIKYTSLLGAAELTQRKHYCAELDSLYQDFSDWKSNADYVNSNPNEFDEEIRKVALFDLKNCDEKMKSIERLYENAQDNWIETGVNGNSFDIDSLAKLSVDIPIYPRIEPKPVAPPTPKPKTPKKESPRYNGNRADAGH